MNVYGDNKKIALSYAKYKKRQMRLSLLLCLIGAVVGVPISAFLLVVMAKLPLELPAEVGPFVIVLFAVLYILLLAVTLFCLSPLAYGIYKVINVLRYYEITVDEVSYVKPFEKRSKTQPKHRTEALYLHGIYFKQYGRYFTENDPSKYKSGEKYYLEICGKNKIIDAFSCEKYELTH
jgi:uncharacterized membrane protein YdbT with pleckstrin-like domain